MGFSHYASNIICTSIFRFVCQTGRFWRPFDVTRPPRQIQPVKAENCVSHCWKRVWNLSLVGSRGCGCLKSRWKIRYDLRCTVPKQVFLQGMHVSYLKVMRVGSDKIGDPLIQKIFNNISHCPYSEALKVHQCRECVRNLDLRVQVHSGELWV